MNNYWESIHGWFDYQKVYDTFVSEAADGDAIAEIGNWLGRSSLYMAAKIQESGKNIRFFTVDSYDTFDTICGVSPWVDNLVNNFGGEEIYQEYLKNIKRAGLEKYITHMKLHSTEAAATFQDDYFYAVFIDANHEYESVRDDIKAWMPKVRKGGLVCGHDYGGWWKGVTKAVDESVSNFDVDKSVWMHRKT